MLSQNYNSIQQGRVSTPHPPETRTPFGSVGPYPPMYIDTPLSTASLESHKLLYSQGLVHEVALRGGMYWNHVYWLFNDIILFTEYFVGLVLNPAGNGTPISEAQGGKPKYTESTVKFRNVRKTTKTGEKLRMLKKWAKIQTPVYIDKNANRSRAW